MNTAILNFDTELVEDPVVYPQGAELPVEPAGLEPATSCLQSRRSSS